MTIGQAVNVFVFHAANVLCGCVDIGTYVCIGGNQLFNHLAVGATAQ